MSDQNTTDQATTTEATTKLYATRGECEAAKPSEAPKGVRPFEVLVGGASRGWVLARGHANAIEQVVRMDGYSATTGGTWGW